MSRKRKARFSGVIGQPHIEGIMMRSDNKFAVVVRKSDRVMETVVKDVENNPNKVVKFIPFVRGVFALIQTLIVGFESMEYTSTIYAQDMPEQSGFDKILHKLFGKHSDLVVSAITVMLSLMLFLCAFFGLPIAADFLLRKYIINDSLIVIADSVVKLLVVLVYLIVISCSKEVRRSMAYHGAEHKCINCIENGRKLTIKRVRDASKFQRRCSTSFIWVTLIVIVLLFIFVRIDNLPLRLLSRIGCVPVAAAFAYEYLRLISKFDNIFTRILAFPVYLCQVFTVREPDDDMIELAIKSLEAVFDWKRFLVEEFPDYYSAYDFGLENVEIKKKLTKKEQIKAAREDSKKYHEKHKAEKEEARHIKEEQRKSREEERAAKHLEDKRRRMEEKKASAAKSIEEILNLNDDKTVESILGEGIENEDIQSEISEAGVDFVNDTEMMMPANEDIYAEDDLANVDNLENQDEVLEDTIEELLENSVDETSNETDEILNEDISKDLEVEIFEDIEEELTEEIPENIDEELDDIPEDTEESEDVLEAIEESEEVYEDTEEGLNEEIHEELIEETVVSEDVVIAEGEDEVSTGILKPSKLDYMDDYGFDPDDEEVPMDTMRFEPVDESVLETYQDEEDDEEDGPLFNKDIISIPMPEELSTFEVLPEGGVVSRIYNYEEEENDVLEEEDGDYDFDNIIDENGRLTLKDTDAFNKKLDEEFEAIMRSLGLEDDI